MVRGALNRVFKTLYPGLLAGMLLACTTSPEGYDEVMPEVYRKLHRFGDGQVKLGDAYYADVIIEMRKPGSDIFDYSLRSELDLDAQGWQHNALQRHQLTQLVEGDSVTWLCQYASLKGSFLDEYANDGKKLPDTASIALTVSALAVMSETDYLNSDRYRRKMQKAEELKLIRRLLEKSGIAQEMQSYGAGWQRILQEGKGRRPMAGDELTLGYEGFFLDSTRFDAALDSATYLYFPYGKPDQVIRGIELVVGHMREGEQRELWLTSDNAFGERGSPGIVPPNTPVRFRVELVEILSADSVAKLKAAEKIP